MHYLPLLTSAQQLSTAPDCFPRTDQTHPPHIRGSLHSNPSSCPSSLVCRSSLQAGYLIFAPHTCLALLLPSTFPLRPAQAPPATGSHLTFQSSVMADRVTTHTPRWHKTQDHRGDRLSTSRRSYIPFLWAICLMCLDS